MVSIFYGYSIYAYIYEIHPPKEIKLIRTNNYGPLKYLTFWDLLLQCLFFTLCAINDMQTPQRNNRRPSWLQSFIDFLFSTVVFSCAVFVSTSFWVIYAVDRELIFPAVFDSFFPSWLNHAVHTLPIFAVLGELCCVRRPFPTQRKGFLTVASFTLVYVAWVFYIANKTGHWVYPILQQLSDVGRAGFIGFLCIIIGLCYILGHGLHRLRWGFDDQQQDLIYHKRK